MGVTVSVISGKGGTGKTTLCAGIAACLAKKAVIPRKMFFILAVVE